jgi:nucleotide-binding universal stress UspA family protein
MRGAALSKSTLLFATDFSAPARRTLPYALKLSSALGIGLTIMHVVKAPPGSEKWSSAARRSLNALKTQGLLELGREAHLASARGVKADPRLLVGIPADSILEVARNKHVELIALGTHGRMGLQRLRLGSVAETVLRNASCPVLTVRAAKAAQSAIKTLPVNMSRLLVATDFSPVSEAAFRFAVLLAKRLHAHIALVHVSESSGPSRHASVQAEARFRKAISASRAEHIVSDRIVLHGKPVEGILDQAERMHADLIVLGTHGRRNVKLMMLGSVSEVVVRKARCPVLVVKAQVRK